MYNNKIVYFIDYFKEMSKNNQVNEVQLSGGLCFLQDHFVMKYNDFFPHLEKLIINPKSHYNRCHLNLGKDQ